MIHVSRVFGISEQDIPTVAEALVSSNWVLCNGYFIEQDGVQLLVLNDSFSEDSAQEYPVLRVLAQDGTVYHCAQVESLTVSWYPHPKALGDDLVRCLAATDTYGAVNVCAEPCDTHRCWRCA